jgi:tetratricopeptide (TPR) repeat protein
MNFETLHRSAVRTLSVKVCLLGFLLSGSFISAQTASRSPLPAGKVTDERIRFFQMQLARDPDYYVNYNHLASAYAQRARETGDISYYDLAEKDLKRSLELESQDAEAAAAWSQLGAVQFAEHRFAQAASSAGRALRLEDNPSARALEGDAQLEMGNVDAAEAAFAKLASSDVSRPHPGRDYLSNTRQAALSWMRGDVPTALSLMKRATTLASDAHLPAENVAWTRFMLGEQMFQSGDIAGAEAEMQSSLSSYPNYHRALAGMGQVRAAQHRFEQAVTYYRQAIAVIPLPGYVTSLGDIYRRLGKGVEAQNQYALVEYIGRLGTLNKQIYNRELALFLASHDRRLPEALALAEKEVEARHDVYTWDVLAWALMKNGRPDDAQKEMQKALALGTRDPMLFFHAAAIEREVGNVSRSSEFARRAIALNPEFHVLYADQAREWSVASPQETIARGTRASK